MKEQMVLLRAAHGTWEGWRCMALDEFLHRVDLRAWKAGQLLVGMVLPPARQHMPNYLSSRVRLGSELCWCTSSKPATRAVVGSKGAGDLRRRGVQQS
jgi:hypothetical protein